MSNTYDQNKIFMISNDINSIKCIENSTNYTMDFDHKSSSMNPGFSLKARGVFAQGFQSFRVYVFPNFLIAFGRTITPLGGLKGGGSMLLLRLDDFLDGVGVMSVSDCLRE
jgi:hypothetical protein